MPTSSHTSLAEPKLEGSMARLQEFLASRRSAVRPVEDLEAFERQLHTLFAAAECEALAQEIARFDVNGPVVLIDGTAHRQMLRCEETYFASAGPVRVERSLYSTRQAGEKTICPMELRAGLIEGRWTPLAARQVAWAVAHLTPQEGEELFGMLGGMAPSKSSLDRLPKQLGQRWEQNRLKFEEGIRIGEETPSKAVTMAVSLDGVMVPMKDGRRTEKRAEAQRKGRRTKGPAGHAEAGCATLSLYDVEGKRLSTIRLGRMPEKKKATLKRSLTEEAGRVLKERPDLHLVTVADGTRDNWEYLDGEFPEGVPVVDFYHAAEHLRAALVVAYGETDPKGRAQFEKLRHLLRDERRGVSKVIRALVHLRNKHPRRRKLRQELWYFRRNRHRMRYAELAAKRYPIGSGVVEAACKTLVTQRLKRSGMRWRHEGGQAILTLRALCQSDRFERGWNLL
ncbi:MAG TPA: hypothetical protein VJQ57_04845, partial [Acidimicrobiia bacterium]|nr:hypothetical protein [Acidimicrobiia bacterium]